MVSPAQGLPGDLIGELFKWILVSAKETETGSTASLRSYYTELAKHVLICKAWEPYAQEVLVETLALEPRARVSHSIMLERMCQDNNRLVPFVRHLQLFEGDDMHAGYPDFALVLELVQRLPLLDSLFFMCRGLSLADCTAVGDRLRFHKTIRKLDLWLDSCFPYNDDQHPNTMPRYSQCRAISTMASGLDLYELNIHRATLKPNDPTISTSFKDVRCRALSFSGSTLHDVDGLNEKPLFLTMMARTLEAPSSLSFTSASVLDSDLAGALQMWGQNIRRLSVDVSALLVETDPPVLGLTNLGILCPKLQSLGCNNSPYMPYVLSEIQSSITSLQLDWCPSIEDADPFFTSLNTSVRTSKLRELAVTEKQGLAYLNEETQIHAAMESLAIASGQAAELDAVCRDKGVRQMPTSFEAMVKGRLEFLENQKKRLVDGVIPRAGTRVRLTRP